MWCTCEVIYPFSFVISTGMVEMNYFAFITIVTIIDLFKNYTVLQLRKCFILIATTYVLINPKSQTKATGKTTWYIELKEKQSYYERTLLCIYNKLRTCFTVYCTTDVT